MASETFTMQQKDELQVFTFREPILCVGGLLKARTFLSQSIPVEACVESTLSERLKSARGQGALGCLSCRSLCQPLSHSRASTQVQQLFARLMFLMHLGECIFESAERQSVSLVCADA